MPLLFVLGLSFAHAEGLTLNLKSADITTLIESVSKATGKNFVVDPRVKGKVTVISSKAMENDELYEVFQSILQVHGFALVESANLVKIVPDASAKQSAIRNATIDKPGAGDELVTRVVRLHHVQANQLIPVLRPLVPQQGHLAAYAATNIIILSDRATNVARLLDIIHQMDRPTQDAVDIITLLHAPATDVVRILNAINGSQGSEQGGLLIQADDWTNSVIMSGEKSERARMVALIAELDRPQGDKGEVIRVAYLQYADAKTTAEVMKPIAEKLLKTESEAAPAGDSKTSPDSVNIQADESIHALIMSGPSSVVNRLEELVKQLDIPRRQVLIEALIAEVSTDRSAELGVQWGFNDTIGTSPSAIGGTSFSSAAPTLATAAASPTNLGNGFALGVVDGTKTFLGTEVLNIRLLLRALAGDADSNVLSTPSLIVGNNKEAEIVVGQNVPFVTGSFTSTGAGASASNPFQTIERQDIGLTLKVKPRIARQGTVQLEIEQEVSSISPSAISASDLITNKRSIKTSVTVEDSHIIALGGLIDDNLQESVQKVPGLGDLPLLGNLFRYQSSAIVKRNLMVFIRPEILRDQKQADIATRKRYERIRNKQIEEGREGVFLQGDQTSPQLEQLDGNLQPVARPKQVPPPPVVEENAWGNPFDFAN